MSDIEDPDSTHTTHNTYANTLLQFFHSDYNYYIYFYP